MLIWIVLGLMLGGLVLVLMARRPAGRDPGPVMRAVIGFEQGADRFAEWTGKLSMWIVIPTVVVGFVNVILRYGGRFTTQRLTNNGMIETQWYLYSLIFLVGFAYILKHQINVRVDFWFAEQTKRRKAWIDLIGHAVALLPFAFIGTWVSWKPILFSWRINEQSPDPSGLPRAPIKTMIFVAFLLLLIQAIAEVIKVFAYLRGYEQYVELGEEPEAPLRVE